MFIDISSLAIYVRPGVTDMRKAINGLSVIVAEQTDGESSSACTGIATDSACGSSDLSGTGFRGPRAIRRRGRSPTSSYGCCLMGSTFGAHISAWSTDRSVERKFSGQGGVQAEFLRVEFLTRYGTSGGDPRATIA